MGSKRRRRLFALDLFSGCGGLTLGMKKAGLHVLGAFEIDALAAETYRRNHRATRVWEGDIRDVDVAGVRRALRLAPGRLDLLAGCPPCQGFSQLRTLRGAQRVRDDRNDLVLEFLRFAREFRPKTIMMENVPGLVSNWRMAKLVRCLRRNGYSCECRVLDAAEYGVPQRRQRVILLAGRRGRVPFAETAKARTSVREAVAWLAHRPDSERDPLHELRAAHSLRVAALISKIPRDGGSRGNLSARSQLQCHKKCAGFYDVYGRMNWNDVAPTITSGFVNPSKGRFLHPAEDRAISLREGALLQTFPPRYYFSLRRGKYGVAEMIGNALPPEFIRRHVSAIRGYLRDRRRSDRRSA